MEEFGGKVYWPDLTTWLRTIRQCKFLDHVDKPFGSSAAIREIRNGKVCGKKSKIRNFATFCYFLPLSTTFHHFPRPSVQQGPLESIIREFCRDFDRNRYKNSCSLWSLSQMLCETLHSMKTIRTFPKSKSALRLLQTLAETEVWSKYGKSFWKELLNMHLISSIRIYYFRVSFVFKLI